MKVLTILTTLVVGITSAMRRQPNRMLTEEGNNGDLIIISDEIAAELEKFEVDEAPPSAQLSERHLTQLSAVVGLIDGPTAKLFVTDDLVLKGWACQLGDPAPLTVQLYSGGLPGTHGSQHIKDARADLVSEGGISAVCRTSATNYRFEIPIEYEDALKQAGKPIYVVAVSTRDTGNTVLGHSGAFFFPTIPPTSVAGFMDGYFPKEEIVKGWACQTNFVTPIEVELYLGGPKDDGGTFIRSMTADQPSEEAIAAVCQTNGRGYRFQFPISELELKTYQDQPIYVYGISSQGTPDTELFNSGKQNLPHYFPIEAFNIRGSATVNRLSNTMEVELKLEAK